MRQIDERILIQQEISVIKTKRSDKRKMIQQNFLEVMDQLNPIAKLQTAANASIDHLFDKLDCIKPFISKIKNFLH